MPRATRATGRRSPRSASPRRLKVAGDDGPAKGKAQLVTITVTNVKGAPVKDVTVRVSGAATLPRAKQTNKKGKVALMVRPTSEGNGDVPCDEVGLPAGHAESTRSRSSAHRSCACGRARLPAGAATRNPIRRPGVRCLSVATPPRRSRPRAACARGDGLRSDRDAFARYGGGFVTYGVAAVILCAIPGVAVAIARSQHARFSSSPRCSPTSHRSPTCCSSA